MSGHNKWSTIKHKKGAADAKRGQLFSKLIKEITVAARMGGGDLTSNARLRTAVLTARAANMPKDNIDRAIKKGTGELEGFNLEEFSYEGYGPGGVAIMLSVLTDNKNRAVADIRHLFAKYNGNLGENGCVAWMFDKKGVIVVEKSAVDEDTLYDIALGVGADDISDQGESFEILTEPSMLEDVRAALEEKNIAYTSAEVSMIPKDTVKVTGKSAQQVLKLMSLLEDHDDIQSVSSNFDIDDEEMAQFQG
ncbi:MAG TPA: YebC/PmpR family DNA-binding transcriptional regulator [Desulfomonilia bacterium]|jgi:YebC/PmpR family DNA-binding regulatory protein